MHRALWQNWTARSSKWFSILNLQTCHIPIKERPTSLVVGAWRGGAQQVPAEVRQEYMRTSAQVPFEDSTPGNCGQWLFPDPTVHRSDSFWVKQHALAVWKGTGECLFYIAFFWAWGKAGIREQSHTHAPLLMGVLWAPPECCALRSEKHTLYVCR
jgi:hypothetical protein